MKSKLFFAIAFSTALMLIFSFLYKDIEEQKLIELDDYIIVDSLIFDVPTSVPLNFNTHVRKFVSNDSLCVVQVSSGKNDPNLYIYHLNEKKMVAQFNYNNLSLTDFLIKGENLYVLLNDYHEGTAKIMIYSLKTKKNIDSCNIYQSSNRFTFVNQILSSNIQQDDNIYFVLKTNKNTDNKEFPLVGYVKIKNKSIDFLKVWYPYPIKENDNKYYYYNYAFVLNDELFLTYSSSVKYTKINLVNNQVQTNVSYSFFTKQLLSDTSINLIQNNYSFTDDVHLIKISGNDYILKTLNVDENKYGSGFSILSLYNRDFQCVGEQILEWIKNREKYLKIMFTQKWNDSLNISCYVYNGKLHIKKGIFRIKYTSIKDFFASLDSIKISLEKKISTTCNIEEIQIQHSNSENSICKLNSYLKKNTLFQNKKHLLIISLDACPTCVSELVEWYFKNYNLISEKLELLILYKNEYDINRLQDVFTKYKEHSVKIMKENKIFISKFLSIEKPFIFLLNFDQCTNTTLQNYGISEIEKLKKDIISSSSIIKILE